MRLARSLLIAVVAAALTLLSAWLLACWAGAGAPSLRDLMHDHPALATVAGLLPFVLGLVSLQRRRAGRSD